MFIIVDILGKMQGVSQTLILIYHCKMDSHSGSEILAVCVMSRMQNLKKIDKRLIFITTLCNILVNLMFLEKPFFLKGEVLLNR